MYSDKLTVFGYNYGLSPRTSKTIYNACVDKVYSKAKDVIRDDDIKYVSLETKACKLAERYIKMNHKTINKTFYGI